MPGSRTYVLYRCWRSMNNSRQPIMSLDGFDVMNIYWSLKNVPELAPLARKQRRRVHEQCLQRHFWKAPVTRRSIAAYLILLVTVFSSLFMGITLSHVFGCPDSIWFIGVVIYFGAVTGRYTFSLIAIPVLRPFYHEFIGKDS